MTLCLNESKVTEGIKTVKAPCTCTVREVEALCACTIREAMAHCTALVCEAKICHIACIKEVEANHASTLAEAEDCCSTAIREAETQGASQSNLIQQSHAKDMQHLGTEAIDEERTDHLTFLATCGSALEASPPKAYGILVTPFHLLLGNAPTSSLLSIPPGVSPFKLEATLQTPPASATRAPKPLPWSKL